MKKAAQKLAEEAFRGIGRALVRAGAKALDSFLEDVEATAEQAANGVGKVRKRVRPTDDVACYHGTVGCTETAAHRDCYIPTPKKKRVR